MKGPEILGTIGFFALLNDWITVYATTIIIWYYNMILIQITLNKSIPARYACKIAINGANYMILIAFERYDAVLSNDGPDLKFGAFDEKLQ